MFMIDTKPFFLESFTESAVVNLNNNLTVVNELDGIIHYVVTDHFSKIVDNKDVVEVHENSEDPSILSNRSNIKGDESLDVNHDVIIEEDSNKISDDELEKIRMESYNKGYEDGKNSCNNLISDLKTHKDFTDLLYKKLSMTTVNSNIDEAMIAASVEAILSIVNKLYLEIPVNFKKVITDGLIRKLQKCYKNGTIKLIVHPNRVALSHDVLNLDAISDDMRNNFQIIEDVKMGYDECRLECNDVSFEYNKEQLINETEKIIAQLKSSF